MPVNHTLAIKRSFLDEDPTLATRIYEAFQASKDEAYRRAREGAEGYLLFPETAFADQAARLGDDPYPFGLEANRAVLEHIVEQQRLDGLVLEQRQLEKLWLDPTR